MKKIENFLETIVALTLVIDCNSIWAKQIMPKANSLLFYLSIFLLVLIVVKDILKNKEMLVKNKKLFLRTGVAILIIDLMSFIFILFNNFNSNSFILKFILLFNLFVILLITKSINGQLDNLLIKISNIICFFALISLILYFLGFIFKIISPNLQVLLNWGDERYVNSYYNLLYETQYFSIFGMRLVRNTGIFTEAPMYAFLLIIALTVQLFFYEIKLNKTKISILAITTITTFSTIGIGSLSLLIILYFLNQMKTGDYKKILKNKAVIFIIACSFILSTVFIYQKIEDSRHKMGSYSIRMDDFKVGIEVWKKNKIFGAGYENYDFFKQHVDKSLRGTDIGGSSGIMHIMMHGGIWLLILNVVPYLLCIYVSFKNKDNKNIIICLLFLALLLVTAVQYTFITIYLLARALSVFLIDYKKEEGLLYEKV